MPIKQRWLLLFARPYKITDENTGEVNEGISINYLPTENLNPFSEDEAKGYKPCKGSIDVEFAQKITSVPALYDISFSMSADSFGKPTIKVRGVEFVSTVSTALVTAKDTAKEAKTA